MKISRILSILLVLVTVFSLSLCVSAEFSKKNTYNDGMFTDVTSDKWYASYVKSAYEFGIMNGNSANTFNPTGTLTVAEGITIAARIQETLSGVAIPEVAGQWYTKYVNYAISKGLMTENQFDSYTRNIKRYEIAQLLSKSCGNLQEINSINAIPDVYNSDAYSEDILKLYRYGILTGNDDYGTFAPESNLLRSEMSAMAVRIADSTQRVKKTFKAKPGNDAYAIIETVSLSSKTGLANGWKYDNRFDLFNTNGKDKATIADLSDEKFGSLSRSFKEESDGQFKLELMFRALSGEDGFYVALQDKADNRLFGLKTVDGKLKLFGTEVAADGIEIAEKGMTDYAVIMYFDLDNNNASVHINNKYYGSVSIPDAPVSKLVLGTNKVGSGAFSMSYARLLKNYAVKEHFLSLAESDGQKPSEWDVTGDFKLGTIDSMKSADKTSVVAQSKAGTTSTASRSFGAVSGKVAFETMVLLPQKADGASVSLMSGDNAVVTFTTKDGGIYVGDKLVNDYIANVWQTLHIEADTNAKTADIYVNGKNKATVSINASYFDGVNVNFAPAVDAVMWFDDVEVYNVIDHADYPAEPVAAESTDYNIGINVCWLWRDQQSGEGWDAVSAFSEFEPYLGYYDEGLRETADWEIKWLAEHGIDFMHACWYCPNGDMQAPIKEMRASYAALHDGYMMAKYSDYVDFCIMWENDNQDCKSFEQFKEYIWNYWVEYYFKDERYVRLDNKALISVWNRTNFEKTFGGEEGARAAVDFMNEELKKLGYDGIIIMSNVQSVMGQSTYDKISALGIDADYAYSWSRRGYNADYQIDCNEINDTTGGESVHHIPTISMGFNDVGRNEVRSPIISVEDHLKVCNYAKDALSKSNTGTWMDNTIMLSTYNEYSEGTYMFPTASTGFSYLENIRKTFTNDKTDHSAIDVKPTEEQVQRVSHMYPDNHSPIRWMQNEPSSLQQTSLNKLNSTYPVRTYDMTIEEDAKTWKRGHAITNFDNTKGVLSGYGETADYSVATEMNFEAFDSKEAPILHIRMKNDVISSFEVFFLTNLDDVWNMDKCLTFEITKKGEFVDYYLDMSKNLLWKDYITALRIDPQMAPGYFEISLVELVGSVLPLEEEIIDVKVNNALLNFTFNPKATSDGDYEVVGEAKNNGFYSAMRFYYEWDRFTGDGVLTLKTYDENTYVFTVGSDKVTVNGTQKDLGFTFKLRDGLPVFHIKKLCELVGYKYTVSDNTIDIQACTDEDYEAIKTRNSHWWEFNTVEDNEGWRARFGTGVASAEGFFDFSAPTRVDVGIDQDLSFAAYDYTHLVIGIEYNSAHATLAPELYFKTDTSPAYSGDKMIKGTYSIEGKQDGDIVEITFDFLSNKKFTGTIKGLRFDPYNAMEPFKIDYIRCICDEEIQKNRPTPEQERQALLDSLVPFDTYDMADINDASRWERNHGVSGFRNDTGVLSGSCATSDYGVKIENLTGIDASKVTYLHIRMKNSTMAKFEVFFITKDDPAWDANKHEEAFITKSGEFVDYYVCMADNSRWKGDIKAVRIDPQTAPGSFEISLVEFMTQEALEQ